MITKRIINLFLLLLFFCYINTANAETTPPQTSNPVLQRVKSEAKAEENPYAITFYRPTYLLPFYETFSPYNSVYQGKTPGGESLKPVEIKYQLSFKVPVWKNILQSHYSFFIAYSQLSYWQAYDHRAFFRETDYEPEIFLADELNYHLGKKWILNFLDVGLVHQSNGQGSTLERSWNRAYLAAIASTSHWFVTFIPWIVVHDSSYQRQNPDMAHYLGHEEIIIACKYGNQVISLETQNALESGGRRAGTTLSWSFPVTKFIKGYVQVFSGYGQSLIEYNHRTNSVGVGIALSNWL